MASERGLHRWRVIRRKHGGAKTLVGVGIPFVWIVWTWSSHSKKICLYFLDVYSLFNNGIKKLFFSKGILEVFCEFQPCFKKLISKSKITSDPYSVTYSQSSPWIDSWSD